MPFLGVPEGGIADVKHISGGDVGGLGSNFGCQFVDDSGVGEGAPGHDLIVAPSGSIGVKICIFDAFVEEVPGSG